MLVYRGIGVFPKIGVPQNGWFIMQNPMKMDDLRVPLFLVISLMNDPNWTLPWSISSSNCYSSNSVPQFFDSPMAKWSEKNHLKMQENQHLTQNLHFLLFPYESPDSPCFMCSENPGETAGTCGSEAVPSRSRESRLTSPALRTSEFENRRDWWKGVKRTCIFFFKEITGEIHDRCWFFDQRELKNMC